MINTTDAGLLVALMAILMAAASLVLWRTQQHAAARQQQELAVLLREHRSECLDRIEVLGRNVLALETSAQNIERLGRSTLTQSRRSQAMHLLRSGMAPETAATNLGIATREMRLIARVSSILSSC